MKKHVFFLMIILLTTASIKAQIFDSIGIISPGNEIEDLCSKGGTLYAATGQSGIWYSEDNGDSWTQTSPFPDAGFGEEWAFSILVASNGDLIVGGNLVYSGAALSGVVFRSSDNGTNWSTENFEGLGGYEECVKMVELSNGDLMLLGGQGKLFISSISGTGWTQTNAPGGVIFGFEQIDDIIYVVNNPAGGTAGTWTTTNQGETWERYGSNGTPVGSGSVTIAPILKSNQYKFIGIGGTYEPRGIYRSGVNDTLWMQKNYGLGDGWIYPTCMATDQTTIWMVIQDVDVCKFTSTTDFGENWSEPMSGLPMEGGSAPCVEKLVVHGTDLFIYANESIYRKEDVAVPTGINDGHFSATRFNIYPNPAVNQLNIQLNNLDQNNGNFELQIFDIGGKVVYQEELSKGQSDYQVDLTKFHPGFYMISILEGENKYLQKLVIN